MALSVSCQVSYLPVPRGGNEQSGEAVPRYTITDNRQLIFTYLDVAPFRVDELQDDLLESLAVAELAGGRQLRLALSGGDGTRGA